MNLYGNMVVNFISGNMFRISRPLLLILICKQKNRMIVFFVKPEPYSLYSLYIYIQPIYIAYIYIVHYILHIYIYIYIYIANISIVHYIQPIYIQPIHSTLYIAYRSRYRQKNSLTRLYGLHIIHIVHTVLGFTLMALLHDYIHNTIP